MVHPDRQALSLEQKCGLTSEARAESSCRAAGLRRPHRHNLTHDLMTLQWPLGSWAFFPTNERGDKGRLE